MQEGWECKKCHNVYAPNVPFCIYCWFNINNSQLPQNQILQMPNIKIEEEKEEEEKEVQIQPEKELKEEKEDKNLIQKSDEKPLIKKSPFYPDTKIFLGGIGHSKDRAIDRAFKVPYVLDTILDFPLKPSKLVVKYFEYLEKNNIEYLLDSGVFSYMKNPKKAINLEEYIQKYCNYINEFDIKNFFELDLDVFFPIEEVENLRNKIYLETHKKPIIVWHEERGMDYWTNMCKDNKYVAIGGLATKPTYSIKEYEKFSNMCDEAHTYGTIVHGLGFASLTLLNSHSMFFDTIDTTSWNFGKHGGEAYLDPNGLLKKRTITFGLPAIETQENDLKVWAEFATNYKGGPRNE